MEKERSYKAAEKELLSTLYSANKALTTEGLAQRCNISRITAKKYLERLKQEKLVESVKEGKGVYWWLTSKNVRKTKDNLAYA